MRKLAVFLLAALGLAAVGWMAGEFLVAQPRGLRVEPIPDAPPEVSLNRADFWTAVRDLDLDSATGLDSPEERRRFVQAVRLVLQGDQPGAVSEFQALLEEAREPRIREEAKEALKRLLRSLSRWSDLAELDPADLDAATYRDAPPERYHFPPAAVRLRTHIGWLRIPRIPVRLNGHSYEFAVDTGAEATVITDEVARECGVEMSEQSRLEETSTSIMIEWWNGLAKELRLGEIAISNHPVAIVRKEDLDLGLVELDGVVGWPVFQHMRVEIDYARGETTLAKAERRASSEPRNLFWLGYPMVTFHSPQGVPLHFGLDTGARNTSLKPNMLNKVDLGPIETGGGMSLGAGGAEAVTRRRVSGFAMVLGPRLFHFERISIREGVKDLAVLAADGRLGGDVAYRGKMVIDFLNGRFELDVPAAK